MEAVIQKQNELEVTLRGIRLAIQFKTFLLSLDLQSRRFILDYCKRWFQLESQKEESQVNSQLFNWFQNAHNIYLNDDEQSKKAQITNSYIWDDLYANLSKSLSFQKLVGFFMNGQLPQENLL
jgi:hypothetical protein